MNSRGRPPTRIGAPRYASRLRELRQRLGLSQQEVARAASISVAYYGALERGDKRINFDIAQRLHQPLRCAVSDLLAGSRGVAVPLRLSIAAAESLGRPDQFDLSEPYEMLHAGRVPDALECVAAEIFDDSADLDFAPGTVLFLHPLGQLREPLKVGAKLVVRFFLEPERGDGTRPTHEILYGVLDQNILGDLVLITRTGNRMIPRHALIHPAPSPRSGLPERGGSMTPRDGAVAYQPRSDDPAEILGLVVYAMGPA